MKAVNNNHRERIYTKIINVRIINQSIKIFLVLFLLTGCAHQEIMVSNIESMVLKNKSSLQRWIEQKVELYFSAELNVNPRFKNKQLRIVSMDGSDIQPDIDKLSYSIRHHLLDSLIRQQSVSIPWQPSIEFPKHHTQLANVKCHPSNSEDLYITLDIQKTYQGQHRVTIRALDIREKKWIGGFGIHWEGYLTTSEKRALSQRIPDETLRGLRVLPFNQNEIDLASRYLANNLSCLLQKQDEEYLSVYLETDHQTIEQKTNTLKKQLLKVAGNHLSQFREVNITSQRDKANFSLSTEIHPVENNLYQVWTVLKKIENGMHLSGMDTATYIRLHRYDSVYLPSKQILKSNSPSPSPSPSTSTIHTMSVAGFPDNFDYKKRCQRIQKMNRSHHPSHQVDDECLVLTVNSENIEQLFVFQHSAPYQLSRIYPGNCHAEIENNRWETKFIVNENIEQGMVPNTVTLYALGTKDKYLSRLVEEHIRSLPDTCAIMHNNSNAKSMQKWLRKLDFYLTQYKGKLHWKAVRL